MKIHSHWRLYGILDLGYVTLAKADAVAREMLAGGVNILQLRAKKETRETICSLASQIAPLCKKAGVPFILNDHPDLAHQIGADGVHVGQNDISVAEARKIVGSDAIVGLSTHSFEQALAAENDYPDYIGFGPLFATPTKPDYIPVGLREISSIHKQISLPIFCIGGIKRENLSQVVVAGAKRVVIVSGILEASDIRDYCRECQALLT